MAMDRNDVENSSSAPDTGGDEVMNRYEGTGVSALLIALCLVAVLAVVFLAQNTASVGIDFLWLSAQAPLFVVLLSTVCVTALATLGVAELWRRRRRRQRSEREELIRLRREQAG